MNSNKNWYKTFFNGLALEFWHKAISEDYTNAEIKFINQLVRLSKGFAVLDVPCGFGRHSIALAKEGAHVISIDISEEYIQQLAEIKEKERLSITPIHADILDYSIEGQFGLALCMGNSFGYFDNDSMRLFVTKISSALKNGGAFIIHTGILAESILPTLKQRNWYQLDDIIFLTESRYHAEQSILQSDYKIIKDEKIECKTAYYYIYTVAEIKRLLTDAGFHKITLYGGTDMSPFQVGHQAYIFCEKK